MQFRADIYEVLWSVFPQRNGDHVYRSEDANKAFSTAVQMYDTLVKAWAHWGDYLDSLFIRERFEQNLFFCGRRCEVWCCDMDFYCSRGTNGLYCFRL